MLLFLFTNLSNPGYYIQNPLMLVLVGFQLWMLIHAIRSEEWMWAVFIFLFPILNAILYYFMVYRSSQPVATVGFELPGAAKRSRIKDLQAKIHHLDKAHHHAELGDVYFEQGNLVDAEKCYRAAIERDSEDIDIRAHFGQCLLRAGKIQEALPILEKVCAEKPDHGSGHSMMALAETLATAGQKDRAMAAWRSVLSSHSYFRAKVQLAELCMEKNEMAAAREELREVLADAPHGPKFQRQRDKIWIQRAKQLVKSIPAN